MHSVMESDSLTRRDSAMTPVISVIVPVRNSPQFLRQCVRRLQKSTFRDMEIVVVDDASTDNTADVARELSVRLIQMDECSGPGKARNRGASEARGEFLFFIDADVSVHPDTVAKVVTTFRSDETIDALFGSYDTEPSQWNIISQYRNLLHHFTHQEANEEASTFWSGCGAVKRSVFLAMNGFDTNYDAPCIEDIELGIRMRKAGYRIRLNKDIQVTHLKHWTLWSTIKTDFWYRGVPWTELIIGAGSIPNDLNLKFSQRVCAICAGILMLLLVAAAWKSAGMLLLPIGIVAAIVALDWWSLKYRVPTIVRILAVAATFGFMGYSIYAFQWWALIAFAMLLAIVLMNFKFYVFFARERQPLFAALVLPLHVIYYVYCSLSFATGVAICMWKNWTNRSGRTRQAVPSR